MIPTRILLATDGSPEVIHATRMAIGLSSGLDSELHVVCVGVAPSVYTAAESEVYGFEYHQMIRERAREEANLRLTELLTMLEESDCRVAGTHVKVGPPYWT